MRKFFVILSFFALVSQRPGFAQWQSISSGLGDTKILTLAIDPIDPKLILAGSEKTFYKTQDGGVSWKEIFSLRGGSGTFKSAWINQNKPKHFYLVADKTLYRSTDGGERWDIIWKTSPEESSRQINFITQNPQDSQNLWVGTNLGVFLFDETSGKFWRVENFPAIPTYSIQFFNKDKKAAALALTSQGIYMSNDDLNHWQKVSADYSSQEDSKNNLGQFDLEEMPQTHFLPNLVYSDSQATFYALTKNGIKQASGDLSGWKLIQGQNISPKSFHQIAVTPNTFYVATNQGVFEWDKAKHIFQDRSVALISKNVNALTYHSKENYLLAATDKGVFKLLLADIQYSPQNKEIAVFPAGGDILNQFNHEPSIFQIQQAAIQYAEVSPEKISQWRKAAARKALLPTFSVKTDGSKDKNIHVDSGSTNTPDTFVIGPDNKSFDWSAGLSWDLGEIIWNNDQTSIDSRSKLMVELRNEILSEVTHLYFERRRLQIEIATSESMEAKLRLEKNLRLQELTATIDALTGGYLSAHTKIILS